MTTIYLLRHSRPFRDLLGDYNVSEEEQIRNEKNPLSGLGETLAMKMSENEELQDIDVLYSSHYVRAMSTAKYIAENNKIKLNVDERLGERKFGVKDIKDLPETFFEDQQTDWNYKIGDGESLNEVFERMNDFMSEVLVLGTYSKQGVVLIKPDTQVENGDKLG